MIVFQKYFENTVYATYPEQINISDTQWKNHLFTLKVMVCDLCAYIQGKRMTDVLRKFVDDEKTLKKALKKDKEEKKANQTDNMEDDWNQTSHNQGRKKRKKKKSESSDESSD